MDYNLIKHTKTNGFRQLWCLKDKFEVINGELVLNDEPLTFEYEDRQSTVEQLQSR